MGSLVLLVVHYLAELVFHTCRILAYAEKTGISSKLYKLGDLLFVLARLSSVILTVLTFWYGLAQAPMEQQVVDLVDVELYYVPGQENEGSKVIRCLHRSQRCKGSKVWAGEGQGKKGQERAGGGEGYR